MDQKNRQHFKTIQTTWAEPSDNAHARTPGPWVDTWVVVPHPWVLGYLGSQVQRTPFSLYFPKKQEKIANLEIISYIISLNLHPSHPDQSCNRYKQ